MTTAPPPPMPRHLSTVPTPESRPRGPPVLPPGRCPLGRALLHRPPVPLARLPPLVMVVIVAKAVVVAWVVLVVLLRLGAMAPAILLQPVDRLHLHVAWTACGPSSTMPDGPSANLLRHSTSVGTSGDPGNTSPPVRSPDSPAHLSCALVGPLGGWWDTQSLDGSFSTMTLALPTSVSD